MYSFVTPFILLYITHIERGRSAVTSKQGNHIHKYMHTHIHTYIHIIVLTGTFNSQGLVSEAVIRAVEKNYMPGLVALLERLTPPQLLAKCSPMVHIMTWHCVDILCYTYIVF